MRVLLDTNVLISALLTPGGAPSLVYAAVRSGVFELVVNRELLAEVEDVLARPKMRRYVSVEEASMFLDMLGSIATVVDKQDVLSQSNDANPTESPDPDDDYLIELVRAAEPEFFVTGDKELLDLVSIGSTLFVSPGDLRMVMEEMVGGAANQE